MPRNRPGWTKDSAHWQARDARDRGPAVGCAARTADAALRRSAHSVLMKRLRDDEDVEPDARRFRRRRYRRRSRRQARRISLRGRSPRRRHSRPHAARRGSCAAWKASSSARADGWSTRPTRTSRSANTARCGGTARSWRVSRRRLAAGAEGRCCSRRTPQGRAARRGPDAARQVAGETHRRRGSNRCSRCARAVEAKAGHADGLARGRARHRASAAREFRFARSRDRSHCPRTFGRCSGRLKIFGVWFGRRTIYLPKLLRPDAASLLACCGACGTSWRRCRRRRSPASPRSPTTAICQRHFLPPRAFVVVAGRAIRLDMLDRLEEELEKGATSGAQRRQSPAQARLAARLQQRRAEGRACTAWLAASSMSPTPARCVEGLAQDAAIATPTRRRVSREEPEIEIRPDSPFAELAALIRK